MYGLNFSEILYQFSKHYLFKLQKINFILYQSVTGKFQKSEPRSRQILIKPNCVKIQPPIDLFQVIVYCNKSI